MISLVTRNFARAQTSLPHCNGKETKTMHGTTNERTRTLPVIAAAAAAVAASTTDSYDDAAAAAATALEMM